MRGERLRSLREQHGESRADVAHAVGISEEAIKHYEAGRREPQGLTLLRLALHYQVSPFWLAGLSDDPLAGAGLPEAWVAIISQSVQAGLSPDQLSTIIQAVTALQKTKERSQ